MTGAVFRPHLSQVLLVFIFFKSYVFFFVPRIYSISCSTAYPEFLSNLEAALIGSYEDMWVYPNFVPEIGSM